MVSSNFSKCFSLTLKYLNITNLSAWWEEDRNVSQRFYNEVLNLPGELVEVGKREDVRKRLTDMGLAPLGGTRREASAFVVSEIEKWRPIVKLAGARPE